MSLCFCFCWLLLPILLYPCWANSNSITLSLTTQSHDHHSENSSPLSLMAYASIQRARHLKRRTSTSTSTPLFPLSIGEYSTTLGFGTPPQRLGFIMDTGSSLVWFPCGDNYKCTSCNTNNIPTFDPKSSSSSRSVTCTSPQLKRFFPEFPLCTSCWKHPIPTPSCSKQHLNYSILYGLRNTTGTYLLESLTHPARKIVPDLLVGCSVSSDHMQRDGIAGQDMWDSDTPTTNCDDKSVTRLRVVR
ncbi:Eukaryotic aspartyl protease family protein [Striga hermonthica]|uniref:Eukaryotic aspartyl protease family protein n=1 Tax=Striga hermonthica TaxID=68872 RepID=A0A9N7RNH0_STRHE|nr:Eukaryotic aspartyl protease family protein [Striga hermonthica]